MSAPDVKQALEQIDTAASRGELSSGAVTNLRVWLTDNRYRDYVSQVVDHVRQGKWRELDDAFWTIIPFGTGGRRGRMYPIGSNCINDRTIGESAQGLAEYVRETWQGPQPPRCALAYDTRHQSRHFAELCAEVMVANGINVSFLDGVRSTPELSVAVRHLQCACGIMVTASHNPPSDNAVKAYWSTGGQLLPPHDQRVIDRVMAATEIPRVPFADALADGRIKYCQEEVDRAYQQAVLAQSIPAPRDLRVLYSPMHGVGASSVCPVLAGAGFKQVEVFAPHAEPDGDFPNIPQHVANPENPATFDTMIAHAETSGADIILSTDPDADRLGCAARTSPGGTWKTFTGNQIGALLTEYVLGSGAKAGRLTAEHYVVKTLVTTELIRRIAESYGVHTYGDLLVGFKWIAGAMDDYGPDWFLFGAEESHGFLAGKYARDKDAAVAALLIAELAAQTKAQGQTLHQKLEALFWQHGCHAEKTISRTMPGSSGMQAMVELMERFRTSPPKSLAGVAVTRVRDYEHGVSYPAGGGKEPLVGPRGDVVVLDLAEEGNYVAVRPSGTEPKVKFYMFAYRAAELLANMSDTRAELDARIAGYEQDLAAYAAQTPVPAAKPQS